MYLIGEIASAHAGEKDLFKNLIKTAIEKDLKKLKFKFFLTLN